MDIDLDELKDALPDSIEIDHEIHDGGQRKVFLVRSSGEEVVLKLMAGEYEDRAERELLIGSTFDHPNLPRILDSGLQEVELGEDRYVWFREELIEGENLAARTNPYGPCEALQLASDLIEAVAYLWERHTVVHRDIKPLNIIRRPDGTFVLIDVGIGRHQGETSITSGALGPGTRGHAAPEQLELNKGRAFDYRTDLFLIGIVVYEVLVGQLPFKDSDPEYEVKLLANDWPRPVSGVDPTLMDLISRLLSRHPHQRPTLEGTREMIAGAKEESGCS